MIAISIILSFYTVKAQLNEFPLTDEWIHKIEKLAPEKPEIQPAKQHKVLVFSLFTGYDHWVVPHTDAVLIGGKNRCFRGGIQHRYIPV